MQAQRIKVFLFLGQSNIAGADAIVPRGADFFWHPADENCLLTCQSAAVESGSAAAVPWRCNKGHMVSSGANPQGWVIGPEVGFCRELWSEENCLAIIKSWANIAPDNDEWSWGEGCCYYDNALSFAAQQFHKLPEKNWSPELGGVIWDQGIDDSFNESRANSHEHNLRCLISSLRKHFAAPALPFVLARSVFSPYGNQDWMASIRQQQVKVAAQTAATRWINIDDLKTVHGHHFSAESQLEAGKRFARAYIDLMKSEARYATL